MIELLSCIHIGALLIFIGPFKYRTIFRKYSSL